MTYNVEFRFKKGTSFSFTNVPAETKTIAEAKALTSLRASGVTEVVKKIIVKEIK